MDAPLHSSMQTLRRHLLVGSPNDDSGEHLSNSKIGLLDGSIAKGLVMLA